MSKKKSNDIKIKESMPDIAKEPLKMRMKKNNEREEFRQFFIKIKNKLQLKNSMEEILWLHLKSSGFDKSEKFEDGIRHFGYNL
jgi:hypothetical protein